MPTNCTGVPARPAAIVDADERAPGAGAGGHHDGRGRRDRERCEHGPARRWRRRRRDPPRRRAGDHGGMPCARRLPDGRRPGDRGRPAAGPLRDPRRRPGVAGRRRERGPAARIRLPAVGRGGGGARLRVGVVPGDLDGCLRLSGRPGGPGGDQLAIRIDRRISRAGKGATHRDRFGETHQRDPQRAGHQLADQRGIGHRE